MKESTRDRLAKREAANSFETFSWGCGHKGPAACVQCFEQRCGQLNSELEVRKRALKTLHDGDKSEITSLFRRRLMEILEADNT